MELRKKLIAVSAMAFAIALGAGVWSANNVEASADQLNGFAITGTSVRLGAGTVADPTGLRFKTVTPEGKDAYENAYTTVTFTSSVEGSEKTYSTDVPATVWREDNTGWNTVLLNIPASDYQTVITATSYVVKGGVTYEVAEAAVTSIAQTASWAMNQGDTDAALATYTAGAVKAVAIDQTTATANQLTTVDLAATTLDAETDGNDMGYGVVWASSDPTVATVDKEGKVTAVKNGTANITATMSGETATCAVTVSNMAITYENGETTATISNIMSSAKANAATTATTALAVVDFNGGKVYGTSATGITGRDMYFAMPNAVFTQFFNAYPTAAAVSFDTYTPAQLNSPRWHHSVSSDDAAAIANIFVMPTISEDYTTVTVSGKTYYKYTWVINRATFENMTAGCALVFRPYGVSSAVLSELYVDNVGVVQEFKAEYDFEGANNNASPVAYIGSSATTSGYGYTTITYTDSNSVSTTTRVLSQTNANQLSSSTIKIPVSRDYLAKVFETSTHFQFDIIANWPAPADSSSVTQLVIEDNTYTQAALATAATAEAVTIGENTFYKLTVRLEKAMFETDGEHVKDFVVFRYKWGGKATQVYLDNFKGVTVSAD